MGYQTLNPNALRSLAMPIFFVIAVMVAVGLFVMVTSKGLVLAMAFGIFVAMLMCAMASAEAGLMCLLVAAYFEGLYKGVSASLFTLLIKDFFIAIALLRLFFVSQRQRNFQWLQQPFTMAAVVFVIYCTALMFAPSTRSMLLALAGFRAWILWMPVYFPAYALFGSKRIIIKFLTIVMLMQLPVNIYGIIQGNIGYEHTRIIPGFYENAKWFRIGPEEAGPAGTGKGTSEGTSESFDSNFKPIMAVRACSIGISPGTFGAMCAVTILLALGLLVYTASVPMRLWCLITALSGAGGLLASGSRAPMVGLAVGVLAMVALSRRRVAAIGVLLVIVLGTVFVLKDISGGGVDRLRSKLSVAGAIERAMEPMKVGWESGMNHPFGNGIATGIGMGRVFYGAGLKTAEGSSFIENEFGRAMSELGIVGASAWFIMICSLLCYCIRAIRSLGNSPEAALCAALLGLMVTVFTQLAVGSALYSQPGMFFWIIGAAILRLGQLKDQAQPGQQPVAPPQRRQKFGRIYLPPGETWHPSGTPWTPARPAPPAPDERKPA